MGIFDKAKEATSSASAKAAEVKREVTAKAGEIKDQASAKAVAIKDSAAAKGSEIMEGAIAKVKDTVRDFNGALPIVKKAGYTLNEVSVELGLPPKVVANFDTTHHLGEAAVQEIIDGNAENKLAVALVKSLFQAQRLQSSIKFVGLAARGISVELGLIPTLVIKFGLPLTLPATVHDVEPVSQAVESAS